MSTTREVHQRPHHIWIVFFDIFKYWIKMKLYIEHVTWFLEVTWGDHIASSKKKSFIRTKIPWILSIRPSLHCNIASIVLIGASVLIVHFLFKTVIDQRYHSVRRVFVKIFWTHSRFLIQWMNHFCLFCQILKY